MTRIVDAYGNHHHPAGAPAGQAGRFADKPRSEADALLSHGNDPDLLTAADLPADQFTWTFGDGEELVWLDDETQVGALICEDGDTWSWCSQSSDEDVVAQGSGLGKAEAQDALIRSLRQRFVGPQTLDEWPALSLRVTKQVWNDRDQAVDVGDEVIDVTGILATATPAERARYLEPSNYAEGLLEEAERHGLFDHDGPTYTDIDELAQLVGERYPALLDAPVCEAPEPDPTGSHLYRKASELVDRMGAGEREALIARLLAPGQGRRPGTDGWLVMHDGEVGNTPDVPILDVTILDDDPDVSGDPDYPAVVRLRGRAEALGASSVAQAASTWLRENQNLSGGLRNCRHPQRTAHGDGVPGSSCDTCGECFPA